MDLNVSERVAWILRAVSSVQQQHGIEGGLKDQKADAGLQVLADLLHHRLHRGIGLVAALSDVAVPNGLEEAILPCSYKTTIYLELVVYILCLLLYIVFLLFS